MEKLPNMNDIKSEDNAFEQSTALNKIVIQLLENKKKENFRSWLAFIVACCVFITAIIGILYDTVKTQDKLLSEMAAMRTEFAQALTEERNAWIEYVQSLETTVVTEEKTETTTTVQQDTGEGNGNNVYQSGEQAQYNEGKGGNK